MDQNPSDSPEAVRFQCCGSGLGWSAEHAVWLAYAAFGRRWAILSGRLSSAERRSDAAEDSLSMPNLRP